MKKLHAFVVAVLIACPALSVAGEGGGSGGNAVESTTVKGSKSNSSERSSGNAGASGSEATTVKGSKSNTSDRTGGSAGEGAAEGTTVKGSKSNSDN